MASIGYIAYSIIPCSTSTSTSRITSGSVRLHPFAYPPFDQTNHSTSPHTFRVARVPSCWWIPPIRPLPHVHLRFALASDTVSRLVRFRQFLEYLRAYTPLLCYAIDLVSRADSRLWHDYRPYLRKGYQWTSPSHSASSLLHCQLWTSKCAPFDSWSRTDKYI